MIADTKIIQHVECLENKRSVPNFMLVIIQSMNNLLVLLQISSYRIIFWLIIYRFILNSDCLLLIIVSLSVAIQLIDSNFGVLDFSSSCNGKGLLVFAIKAP